MSNKQEENKSSSQKALRKNKQNSGKQENVSVLRKIQYDLEKLKGEYGLRTPKIAVDRYTNDPKFKKRINNIDSELGGKGKLRKLEAIVGAKFVNQHVKNFNHLSFKDKCGYIESIYADDFGPISPGGAVSNLLLELAMEYGPSVIDWLFGQANKAYATIQGHGSGTGLLSTSMPITGGCGPFMGGPSRGLTDSNTVDLLYIASVFCPEKYNTITPDSFSNQIVCTAKEVVDSFITGTDGNGIGYYLPDAATQNATIASWAFAINNAGTVNVTTGLASLYQYNTGAFFTAGSNNVARYRSTTGSIRLVPNLAAVNNSGSITLAYFTESPLNNTAGVSAPAISSDLALQAPFLHIAAINGTSEMRQIHIPHDVAELELDDFDDVLTVLSSQGGLDNMYVLIQGAPVNTNVLKCYRTTAIDYMNGPGLSGLVKLGPSPDAPGSLPCVATLIKRLPHLTQLTLDEAISFSEKIVNLGTDRYSEVVQAILSMSTGFKPRNKKVLSTGGGGSMAPGLNLSMEILKSDEYM
jgi:hypothetical protein